MNARTTPAGRAVMVRRVLEDGCSVAAAADAFEVSVRTVRKKLASFPHSGHRVTGERRGQNSKVGYEFVHVALDDASRPADVEVLSDEKRHSVTGVLVRTPRWFKRLGIRVERVMSDNRPGYVSRLLAKACRRLRLRDPDLHPRTNIQTLLREWAHAPP
jgi:transposase